MLYISWNCANKQMKKHNPIEALFGKDERLDGNAAAILELLGKYGIRSLAYDGDLGCNPGYIFRGEAAFDVPLRSSLERTVRKKLGDHFPIDGETLRAEELQLITCFVDGLGGRAASIFYPDGKVSPDHPKNDVFWWLSLMQHYDVPTRLIDFTRDIRLALYFAVAQHDRHLKNHGERKDLAIYCFPCKNPKDGHDPDNNKCPFKLGPSHSEIDMNKGLGCLIDLLWMKPHQKSFEEDKIRKRDDQSWGWDQPRYQNPRLRSQKGMFVYPYDYPGSDGGPLTVKGQSWLVQNLTVKTTDRCNLGGSANDWPPRRIRIDSKHAKELREHLEQVYEISKGTVYERYAFRRRP
jgi:hypothetical protein